MEFLSFLRNKWNKRNEFLPQWTSAEWIQKCDALGQIRVFSGIGGEQGSHETQLKFSIHVLPINVENILVVVDRRWAVALCMSIHDKHLAIAKNLGDNHIGVRLKEIGLGYGRLR